MKLLNFRKKAARGFTLIEILLVVGFIALAGIGVYVVYNKVAISGKANDEVRNLETLRSGIKSIYGGQQNYGAITKIVALQARVVPDSMKDATNTTINNSFGGAVTIDPVTLGAGGANNGFRITYPSVPGAVCIKLAAQAANSFDQVTVGATDGNVRKFGINTTTIETAAAACNTGDVGSGVTMMFDSL